ncbi:hypothetical protein ScPMuIL_005048 [Solemya velum]
MSGDLTLGSVPPFYREVYEIVCPNQEQVDQDLFVQLLVKSSLPKPKVIQIWELADNKQGFLTRNGLYKALALTALAQQGKTISDQLLGSFSGQELPKPTLGDLSDLKYMSMRLRRERSPNLLGFSYQELCDLDTIKVELVPEKKGLILKHVEYEVTSQKYRSTVLRRYNDFLSLHELLLNRYPYRLVPRLPPKKMMGANREFIEHRRKCLKRFINLVSRHPQMHGDNLLKFFLTFTGSETHHKIKESFRGSPDEFMASNLASTAKDLVPMDTVSQMKNSREHINILYASVTRMKEVAEKMVLRATGYASDMLQFGRELGALGNDSINVSSWATGSSQNWKNLQTGFKQVAVEYSLIADTASDEAADSDKVLEKLSILMDLLQAYKDLSERHEKGVVQDHQKALQKMSQYKKKMVSASGQTTGEAAALEQLEQKILQQESQIANMENRNHFSQHCMQMETQLVHTNLDIVYEILSQMSSVQSKAHTELGKVWSNLIPKVNSMNKTQSSGPSSPTETSPVGSPVNNKTMAF